MAPLAKLKPLALDSNLPLDLAANLDAAHTFREVFLPRGWIRPARLLSLEHLFQLVCHKWTSENSGFDLRENSRRQVAMVADFFASDHAAQF